MNRFRFSRFQVKNLKVSTPRYVANVGQRGVEIFG